MYIFKGLRPCRRPRKKGWMQEEDIAWHCLALPNREGFEERHLWVCTNACIHVYVHACRHMYMQIEL